MTVLCGFEDFVVTKFCKGAASFMTNHVMSSNGSFTGNNCSCYVILTLKMNDTVHHIFSKGCLKGVLISGAPNNSFLLNALKTLFRPSRVLLDL